MSSTMQFLPLPLLCQQTELRFSAWVVDLSLPVTKLWTLPFPLFRAQQNTTQQLLHQSHFNGAGKDPQH